jgi:rSAM/selenodomain-associated transferase 1
MTIIVPIMPGPFHVAVFARAPVAGAAKTRLIPLLGPEGAAAAHQAMVLRALETACAAAHGDVSLWTAGDATHLFFGRCAERFRLSAHPQRNADLGQRMAACLHALLAHHEAVLLTGTDCPVLSVDDLQDAASALRAGANMVFTPAEDGGYVLVGARQGVRSAALDHTFSGIDWSTAHVMAQTRERMAEIGWRQGHEFREMSMRWDVDEPADYLRAQAAGLLTDAKAMNDAHSIPRQLQGPAQSPDGECGRA